MATKLNLTKKEIAELPTPPEGKRAEYYDTQIRGLLIRVTSNGKKAFYVRRKKDGVSQRLIIGPFPETSLEEARKKAFELCAALVKGDNPRKKAIAARSEPTFGELLDEYLDQHARQRCLAAKEIEAVFRRYLSDWRQRRMNSISKSDVQRKLNDIANHHGVVPANHTLTYAKAAINWCINQKVITCENPWTGVEKFKTQARERFIKPDEFERFFAALKNAPNESGIRDYVYLSLFTGARQANVLAMRWEQIDFNLGIWTIPRTKSGDSQTIPLTSAALEILTARQNSVKGDWVFPGDGKTGHLVEPKKGWHALLEAAGIKDLRMHDLRRTLGSYMAMGNQSLHMIGKALGHKSPTATQIYSQLSYDPLRQAMEKAQTDMLIAGRLLPEKENAGQSKQTGKA